MRKFGFRREQKSTTNEREITELDNRRIGKMIASARKEKGYTQTQLSEKINVSFQAVSSWERGETIPDLQNLIELSNALEVSIDALLGRAVKAEPANTESKEEINIEAIKAEAVREYIENNKSIVNFDEVFSNRNRYSQQQIDSTAVEYIKQTGDIVKIREKFSLISYPALKEITRIRYEQTGDAIEAACFIGPLLSTLDGIKMAGDLKALGADDEDVASVINGRAWREKYVLQNYDAQTVTDIIKNRRYSQRDIDDIAIAYVEKTMDVATVRSLLMLIGYPALCQITRVIYEKTNDAVKAAGFIGPYLNYNDKQKMIADLKALGADDAIINDVLSGKVWRSKHPAVLCDAASLVKILTQERHMHTQLDMDELAIAYLDNTMDVKTIRSVLMQISNPAIHEITRIIYAKTGDAVEAASFVGPYLGRAQNILREDLIALGVDSRTIANIISGTEWNVRQAFNDGNSDADENDGELNDNDVEAMEFVSNGGSLNELVMKAPFMSRNALGKIVKEKIRKGASVKDAVALAPFLGTNNIDVILKAACYQGIRVAEMTAFAPFASQDTIEWVIDYKTSMGAKIADMVGFAPFATKEAIDKLIKRKCYDGAKANDMVAFVPFMREDTARWFIDYKIAQGANIGQVLSVAAARGDLGNVDDLVLLASQNGMPLESVMDVADIIKPETIRQAVNNSFNRMKGIDEIINIAGHLLTQQEIDELAIRYSAQHKDLLRVNNVFSKISLPALKQIAKNYYSNTGTGAYAAAFIYPKLDEAEKAKLIEDFKAIDSNVEPIINGTAWKQYENEYWRSRGYNNQRSSHRNTNKALNIDDVLKLGGILDEDEIYEIVCDRMENITTHDLIMLKEVLTEDQLNELVLDRFAGDLEGDEIVDLINEGVIFEDTAFELAEESTPLSIDDLVSLSAHLDDDEISELAIESDLDIDEIVMLRGLIDDDCLADIVRESCDIDIDLIIKLAAFMDHDVVADLITENAESFTVDDIARLKGVIDEDVLRDIVSEIL